MTTGTAGATVGSSDPGSTELDRADRLLSAGRADEAVVLLRGLTRRQPNDASIWHRLAGALLASGAGVEADAGAREAAEHAVTLDPTSALGYRMLSEAALRLGDPDSALATMRAAVQAAPDSWVTHLDLAAALIDRPGGAREADRIARRAARLAPDRPEPHLMVGDLALRADDVSAAAAAYADALDADPDNQLAHDKLAELHRRLEAADPGAGHRPARALGTRLAGLSALAVPVIAMLLVLAPEPIAGWYRIVVVVAAGGLTLLTGALAASARRMLADLPDRAGYRTGLAASAGCLLATIVTLLVAGLTADGTTALRAAVCTAVGGYAAGHLLARFADRAATPVPDDRQADRIRSGGFFGLALGSLAHAVVLVALALLTMALPRGAGQVVAVLMVLALIFVAGIQYAALAGLAATHRQRFGWRPYAVLVGVGVAGAIDLVGSAGGLSLLFTASATVTLLTAAFLALLLATVCALGAATLRN